MAAKGEYFTQVLHKPCQQLVNAKVLTHIEGYFLFCLLGFVAQDTNIIVNEENKPLNITSIAKLVGLTREHTSKIVKGLEDIGLLTRESIGGRQTGIKLNRKYFINGNK